MASVSISELARLVNPAPGRKVIAMLEAYLDGSFDESRRAGVTSVAGYVAPLAEWKRVEAAWRDELSWYRLECFRLSDIRYEFSVERQEDLVRSFKRVIESSQIHAIGSALLDSDWKEENWGSMSTVRLSSPYEQALDMAFGLIGKLTNQHYPGERVGIMCCPDASEDKIEVAYKRKERDYPQFISGSIGRGRDVVPLQVADLGAGLLRESWGDVFLGKAKELSWGSMPKSKSAQGMNSVWSLPHRQAPLVLRQLREASALMARTS